MSTNDRNLLYTENNINVMQTYSTATTVIVAHRMGMWGEAMFGDVAVLGALISNTYNLNNYNVRYDGKTLNTLES